MAASRPPRDRAALTEGSVPRRLFGLAGPMAIGIIAVMAVNLVDTLFVSMLGATHLAAMSFTFPVVALLATAAIGLGVGTSSVLSRAIGAREEERVRRVATDAVTLSFVIVAVLSTIGWFTIEPLFTAMGADENTLPLVVDYMSIWYLGMVFLVVPMVSNSAIRATGDASTPAKIMVAAAVSNAVLDPLLIWGWGPVPAYGIAGAAIATVISRAIAAVAAIWVMAVRDRMFTRRIPSLAEGIASWRSILRVGLPAAATNAMQPITLGVLTGLVATHGEAAVAAFGAGGRIEALASLVPIALGSALGPFVGQNWGAGAHDRVAAGQSLVERINFGWGLAIWVVLVALAEPLAGAFTDQAAVLEPLRRYLWIVPAGLSMQGLVMAAGTSFNAINRPGRAAALAFVRTPLLVVPLAWAGSALLGLEGIFGGMVVAMVATGLLARRWTGELRAASPFVGG